MLHLLRPLGEGGMGKVWVARHKGLETEVVVKFLAAAGADREDAEARFAREASAAAAVKSPHVVQVFDHGTTADGVRYIVMELLEGRDLATHLATNGPMAPRDVAGVVTQVAKALSKAHQVGVIHRDIKPENIFLCDGEGGEMFVKVLDFGIAKREQQQATAKTTTGQVIGTPYYMSPEQILGEQAVDARTDIWALGVVAFEALTGKRPFEGATVGSVTLAIHQTRPRPSAIVPSLPPALDEWFARACARAPGDRFTGAREAAQAMIAAIEATPGSVSPFRLPMMSIADTSEPSIVGRAPGEAERSRSVTSLSSSFPIVSPRRRPPALLLGGAAAAILVLGLLFVIASRRGPSESSAGVRTMSSSAASIASATTSSSSATTASATPPAAISELAATPSASAPAATTSGGGREASAAPVTSAERAAASGMTAARATTGAAPVPKSAPTSTVGRTAGTTTGGKGSTRPPRRPNDDDIK